MARIFQNSAGTTPVTTYDQPVGKIVRGAGTVDLVQSVSGSRLTMARWPRGGRRNLLTWTEDVSKWYNSGITAGSYEGTPAYYETAETIRHGAQVIPPSYVSGETYTRWADVKPIGRRYILVTVRGFSTLSPSGSSGGNWNTFDTQTGTWRSSASKWYASPQSDGFWRLGVRDLSTTPDDDKLGFSALDTNDSVLVFLGDPSKGLAIKRAQYELGVLETPYQRVTTANDVTEEGVESLWHLYNDGGDSLQTDGPVPAGAYGYAYVDPYGEITFDTRVSDGTNPVLVADAPGRYLDLILRKGDFSTGEKDNITNYWERRYK